ncbi:polysaccharide deacetylase family protein [Aquimarina intermedia]|uniref:DUF7033 domain-containing protein n=1 Tax=Aquimarina intermedia TaxID=350814 RepID=A0A5S5C567_9FLAO|nr:polysaccharide deacetylase family protein [Aquimarina intermedia]TYP73470.1 hypothetical protein BD809_10557 [Aquimarina intermedia]
MLLIYVHKITPRVSYTLRHICKRILGIEVELTSKIETFIAHDGPKFSYGKKPLGKELYFQSVDLLFEHGITDTDITVYSWEDTKCFFPVKNEASALPFDIFSATFYLLSRYEEYLPHVKDDLGRFPATESLGYTEDFLQDPVVDIWAYRLCDLLKSKYPDIVINLGSFSIRPIVKVSQTFIYKQKGVVRSVGASLRDVLKLRFRRLIDRLKVLSGFMKDPYDTFDLLIEFQKHKKRDLLVVFGLGDYSSYEKNINFNKQAHQSVIKHVSDYIDVGLKVSYEAIDNVSVLKKEKKRIESIFNRQLKHCVCSFYKLKLPEAYRNFIELEIENDFSMGYPDHVGFRAGTCTPFLFYDLDYEVQTPLLVHSFYFTSEALSHHRTSASLTFKINTYIDKIKKVNGCFMPVFSNDLFSDLQHEQYWKSVYELIWNYDDE